MFKKALIAEDQDVINNGVVSTLKELNVDKIEHSQYCDEALLKIKKSYKERKPYEVFICDLSFVKDHHEQKINSGVDLIEAVRKEFSDIKIIVFSIEDRKFTIQNLFNNHRINGYVLKSRNGARELKKAVQECYETDSKYISPELNGVLSSKNVIEINDFDIFIIQCLSEGSLQEAISIELKKQGKSPSSISAIEKRIKLLKENFNAKNPTHLVSLAKDLGLI